MTDTILPLISVIIPSRNRADRLSRALESVLAQEGVGSGFELEIIVIDDASSDNTAEVVRRYAPVRYIRLESGRGVAAARNVGLRASTGHYIAFQDDDDLWLPHKLRMQMAALDRHPEAGLVYSQSIVRVGDEEFLWPDVSRTRSGWVFPALLMECFCAHPPALLMRREVFATVGYFDEQLTSNEDYDLWLRISFHFPFQFVAGPVAVYHMSSDGLYYVSMSRGSGLDDARRVVRKALKMLPETREYEKIRREVLLASELTIAQHSGWFEPPEENWGKALDVLRSHPEILRYRWGRGAIAMDAHNVITRSAAAIATGRRLCDQLRTAAPGHDLKDWFRLRLTLASVWAEAAMTLADGSGMNIRAAGWAATRAILYNPAKLRMLWLMARATLRILVDPFITLRQGRQRPL